MSRAPLLTVLLITAAALAGCGGSRPSPRRVTTTPVSVPALRNAWVMTAFPQRELSQPGTVTKLIAAKGAQAVSSIDFFTTSFSEHVGDGARFEAYTPVPSDIAADASLGGLELDRDGYSWPRKRKQAS